MITADIRVTGMTLDALNLYLDGCFVDGVGAEDFGSFLLTFPIGSTPATRPGLAVEPGQHELSVVVFREGSLRGDGVFTTTADSSLRIVDRETTQVLSSRALA